MTRMVSLVLAGGAGTRLGSMTRAIPKPLLMVDGRPMIDHTLEQCVPVSDATVITVSYRAGMFYPHLVRFWPDVIIRHETSLLNTGGSVKHQIPFLATLEPSAVMVLAADHTRDVNLTDILGHHQEQEHDVTVITSAPAAEHNQIVLENGLATGYAPIGTPARADAESSTGEYVFSWPVLSSWVPGIPEDVIGLGEGIIAPMIASCAFRIGTFRLRKWVDLGTPERLNEYVQRDR